MHNPGTLTASSAIQNAIQSILLLAAMCGLLGLIGWLLAGPLGIIVTILVGGAFLLFGARVSARMLMTAVGARPLAYDEVPELYRLLQELTRRAALDGMPRLYLMPSRMMLAFTLGGGADDAAIALSGPLLRGLGLREMAGVLAHEVSHIQSRDLSVMNLADRVSRLTRGLSSLGLFLVLLNLPLMLTGGIALPWEVVLLLLLAPTVSLLLQLALSRTREYEADRNATLLTGDPIGLASALEKLEVQQRGFWQRLVLPSGGNSEPSLLRTHPPTRERIERLLAMQPETEPLPPELLGAAPVWLDIASAPLRRFMRWWW